MTSEMIWPENSLTSRETATPFIRVLGPLQLQAGQIDCTPTAPKVRQVLALLVLRSNQLVSTEALMEDLWEGCPPRSSLTTLQTYIYHLRKMIEREGIASDGEEVVETRPPGYSLRIAEDSTDLQISSASRKRAARSSTTVRTTRLPRPCVLRCLSGWDARSTT